MERIILVLTFLSALGAGLMAGIYFVFSIAVMRALGRLPPADGIAAMQAINAAILNPIFFIVFFGTSAAAFVLAVAALFRWSEPGAPYLHAGGLLFIVSNLVVTMAFNVPLNNALAKVKADSAEGTRLWTRYLSAWTAWNHVRTVGCLAATAAFIMALR